MIASFRGIWRKYNRKCLIIIISLVRIELRTEKGRARRWAAVIDAKANIDIEPRRNDVTSAEVTSFRRLLVARPDE